jgi:hypothetical protein
MNGNISRALLKQSWLCTLILQQKGGKVTILKAFHCLPAWVKMEIHQGAFIQRQGAEELL